MLSKCSAWMIFPFKTFFVHFPWPSLVWQQVQMKQQFSQLQSKNFCNVKKWLIFFLRDCTIKGFNVDSDELIVFDSQFDSPITNIEASANILVSQHFYSFLYTMAYEKFSVYSIGLEIKDSVFKIGIKNKLLGIGIKYKILFKHFSQIVTFLHKFTWN